MGITEGVFDANLPQRILQKADWSYVKQIILGHKEAFENTISVGIDQRVACRRLDP